MSCPTNGSPISSTSSSSTFSSSLVRSMTSGDSSMTSGDSSMISRGSSSSRLVITGSKLRWGSARSSLSLRGSTIGGSSISLSTTSIISEEATPSSSVTLSSRTATMLLETVSFSWEGSGSAFSTSFLEGGSALVRLLVDSSSTSSRLMILGSSFSGSCSSSLRLLSFSPPLSSFSICFTWKTFCKSESTCLLQSSNPLFKATVKLSATSALAFC
mmetsp:Transcript_41127/g.99099  ORF Transcript_41127/g.99099 Transcript_41127/m.99099 type:complete len:215 (+) Transcript_41127:456-1100(+)